MSIFQQDNDGDFALTDGKLVLVEGAEECATRIRNRLYSLKGEWFADSSVGFPYVQIVQVSNPDLELIRRVYEDALFNLPGVAKVNTLELALDRLTRDLVVTIEVTHDSGAKIVGGTGTPFRVEDF